MQGVTSRVESHYRTLLARMQPGERLPSERSIMTELRTCRSTVRLVLTKLAAEKAVVRVQGQGTFKAR